MFPVICELNRSHMSQVVSQAELSHTPPTTFPLAHPPTLPPLTPNHNHPPARPPAPHLPPPLLDLLPFIHKKQCPAPWVTRGHSTQWLKQGLAQPPDSWKWNAGVAALLSPRSKRSGNVRENSTYSPQLPPPSASTQSKSLPQWLTTKRLCIKLSSTHIQSVHWEEIRSFGGLTTEQGITMPYLKVI